MQQSLFILLISLILLTGCATTSILGGNGDLLPVKQAHETYHLAPLDTVDFQISDGTKQTGKVDAQGVLQIDPDIHLKVLGQTIPEVNEKLRSQIPHISKLHWTEFRENSVSILGEVFNQTKVDLGESPLRVLDIVAAAGGFTPLANQENVILVRRNVGETQTFILNLAAAAKGTAPQFNILVMPGDVITIRRTLL
jgi:polysaccharide export outer membrane protein